MHRSSAATIAGLIALASAAAVPIAQEATNTTSLADTVWTPDPDASSPLDPAACKPSSEDYITTGLVAHNLARDRHQSDQLSWDERLACVAQQQAETCSTQAVLDIGGGGYGSNTILVQVGDDAAEDPVSALSGATDIWLAEEAAWEPYYGFKDPPLEAASANQRFTQMVWKASTKVGCATYRCDRSSPSSLTSQFPEIAKWDATVCSYYVAGNDPAAGYDVNVLPVLEE